MVTDENRARRVDLRFLLAIEACNRRGSVGYHSARARIGDHAERRRLVHGADGQRIHHQASVAYDAGAVLRPVHGNAHVDSGSHSARLTCDEERLRVGFAVILPRLEGHAAKLQRSAGRIDPCALLAGKVRHGNRCAHGDPACHKAGIGHNGSAFRRAAHVKRSGL